MTSLVSCCLCSEPYRPTLDNHNAFCPKCVMKIKTDAAVAESHVRRINAGCMRETPASDRERDTRDAARRAQLRRLS